MSNNKGKGKATERTPLLVGAPTSSRHVAAPTPDEQITRRRRVCSHLLTLALAFLSLLILAFLFILLITRPSAPTPSPAELFDKAVHFRGPHRVEVINVTDPLQTPDLVGGLWLRVDGEIYVDAETILSQMDSSGVWWWQNLKKGLGRWLIRTLHNTTVDLGTVHVYPREPRVGTPPLVTLQFPAFNVPLEPNVNDVNAPYSRISLPILVWPTRNVSALNEFAEQSWNMSSLALNIQAQSVRLYGGDMTAGPMLKSWLVGGWKGLLQVTVEDVKKNMTLPIPPLPGLPPPGSSQMPSLGSLVTLVSYSLATVPSSSELPASLSITAEASIPNIFPHLHLPPWFVFTMPSTPFAVSLPVPLPHYHITGTAFSVGAKPPTKDKKDRGGKDKKGKKNKKKAKSAIVLEQQMFLPVADMTVPSISIPAPGSPINISLSASGHFIPLRPSTNAMQAMSPFLSAYLSGESYPVLVTIDLPLVSSPGTGPGEVIDPSKTLSFRAMFPAVQPKPKILQGLTIKDMTIRYGSPITTTVVGPTSTTSPGFNGASTPVAAELHWDLPLPGPIAENAQDYTILASGTVWARVVLPKQIDVEHNVTRVWPDILLFDGAPPKDCPEESGDIGARTVDFASAFNVPQLVQAAANRVPAWQSFSGPHGKEQALAAAMARSAAPTASASDASLPWPNEEEDSTLPSHPHRQGICFRRPPAEAPLPDPLPEGAFARVRPSDWLAATSESSRTEDGRRTTIVQAKIEDIPVTVLPGREGRMRSFVSKAIFSRNGAEAGLNGITAVALIVDGLVEPRPEGEQGLEDEDEDDPQEIELHGLPVDGSVRVGGKLMN